MYGLGYYLTHKPDKSDVKAVFAEGQGVIPHPRAATDVAQHQNADSLVGFPVPLPHPSQQQQHNSH